WGRFWGWDPKETWALITWVVYAGYLHTRITLGWAGKRPAAIAVFACAVVVFTFMGVNLGLTGEGLHTYGAGCFRGTIRSWAVSVPSWSASRLRRRPGAN